MVFSWNCAYHRGKTLERSDVQAPSLALCGCRLRGEAKLGQTSCMAGSAHGWHTSLTFQISNWPACWGAGGFEIHTRFSRKMPFSDFEQR